MTPGRVMIELLKLSVLAALIGPANQALMNFIIFHPDRDSNLDPQVVNLINKSLNTTWQDEYFSASDGTRLHGWYIKNPKAQKTFLVSHGNAGNVSHRVLLIAPLINSGASVFLYDYRGYGKSAGKPSPEGIVQDGLAAYDFLNQKKQIAAEDIVLYGESLGCAVSTNIMEKRKVAGVVLQSGFSNIITAGRDRLPWLHLYPESLFPQRFLDNLTAYRSAHPPLLLLHGAKDLILPARYSQAIYETACEPKMLVLLPNCGHNDVHVQDVEISTKALQDFLNVHDRTCWQKSL